MAEFRMPSLGADMTAGTLIGWMKGVGERVSRGDIIAEVDTDKGVIEVEVFTDGVIDKLLIEPGSKVPVGTVLAIIDEESPTDEDKQSSNSQGTSAVSEPTRLPRERAVSTGRRLASPAARKLAESLGIDLTKIEGTGPKGRIQLGDVQSAAKILNATSSEAVARIDSKTDRSARMRAAIASAMTRSKREIPHYYLHTTIDLTRALEWLDAENTGRAIKDRILYNVLLIKAVAIALRDVPELNGSWEDGRLNINESVNIGVAISVRQGGLAAPALFEADKKSLGQLMLELRDLVERTRASALRSSELSEPTITVTSLGDQNVETVFGVIYPPQVALVGFGKIIERPMIVDGTVQPRQLINATLSADHRASDGHRGGSFLSAIVRVLQEPEKL
ncbi:MAG: 2-oxo acid dehydrogenase subunit E2 [Chloracidobacterium sp.]|nr:2-oxo acid dehydrogenase subunit E2 [Chloracidobacterium sp.]